VSDNVEKRFEPGIYIHTYIHTYSIDSKVTMIGERKIGRVLKKRSDLIGVLYRRRIEESLNISPMITCAPYKMRLPNAVLERYAATPC